ncbi:MAG TPA: kelch repeat-containing protein, partial [bacterium]|nr:kelch repeat-containing protein [bacterium]
RDDLSEISMKMVVDKSVPDISATDFSKITYHRLPFGEKNDPSTRFFVEGDEGSVESERLVYLFNTPYEPSRTSFAGSISPESDGSFLIDTREVGNSPYMFLRIGNKAGNLSEPERIRLNKWTGTLKGKIPGSSAENGIEYGKRVLKIDSLKNSGELMKYLENFEDVQKISDSDAVFLSTGNDSGLKLDSHNPDELPILENSNFIVDPVRNQIFVLNFPDETSQIDIYSVDVSSKTLKPLGYIGVSPNPRNGFNLLYNYYDNSIFFAGGSISGTNMDDVWEFDPDTLEWKQITPDWSQIDPWVEDGTKTGAFSVPKAWASFIDVINYDIEEHKLYYFRFADGSYAGNHLNGVAVYDVRYKIWSSFIQDSTPIPYPDMYGFDVSSGFYDVSESKICFAGRKKIYRMNSFTGVWDVVDLTPVAFTSVLGFDSIRRNLILSNYAQVKSYNLDTQEEKPVKDFGAFYPEKFDYLSMSDNFYFIDDNEIVKEVSASDFTVSDAMKVPLYSAIPSKTDGNPVYFYSDINDALYVYMGYYTNQHYRQLWKFSFEDEKWTNLEPESQVYTSQPPSLDSKTIFYRKSTGRITVAGPYWASKSYFYEFNEATEQMKWSEVLLGTDPAPSGTYEAVAVDNVNEIYYFLVCVLNNQDCTVHSFNDINKSWSNLGIGIAEKSSYYQMQYIPGYSYLIVNASAADEYDVNKTLIYDVAGSTLLKTLTLDDSPENIRTLSYVDFSEKLLSVQTDVYNGTVWSFNFDSLEWEKKEKTTAITANYNEGIFLFERKTPQSEIFLINKINKLMNFDYGFTSRTENILELPLPVIYNDRNNSNPDIISSLTVSAISKGFSYNDNKEKIEGVELSVWNKEKWGVVDQNNAGAEEIDPSLMELNFTFDNRIDIKRLFDHGEKSLFVKMSPYGIVGKNGKLDVDFIQIEVEYSLPE